MKVDYVCEYCGNKYPTKEEALKCEVSCASKRDDVRDLKALSDMYGEYIIKYNKMPKIRLSKEADRVADKLLDEEFAHIAKDLSDMCEEKIQRILSGE